MGDSTELVRRGIEANAALLYRTARYVLRDPLEAEDAAQEAALGALDTDLRVAMALHYFEGFSHREVGRMLNVPDSTVSDRIKSALKRLRRELAAAGLAVAMSLGPEAALCALPFEPAPPTLMAELEKLVSGGAGVKTTGAAATSAALKGGIIVKIGLTVAAAGLVAGGVFWAVGGKSEESRKPAPAAAESHLGQSGADEGGPAPSAIARRACSRARRESRPPRAG